MLMSNISNVIIVGRKSGKFGFLRELRDTIVGIDSAADVSGAGATTSGGSETLGTKWSVVMTLGSL